MFENNLKLTEDIMKSIKLLLTGVIFSMLLASCSARENHQNTTQTNSPAPQHTENNASPLPEGYTRDEHGTVRDAAGNIIDGAGNIIDDAGNIVQDAANGVGDAVKDVGDAVSGNNNNKR